MRFEGLEDEKIRFVGCKTKVKVYDSGYNLYGGRSLFDRIGTIKYDEDLERHLYYQWWHSHSSVLRMKPIADKLRELDQIKREKD